MKSMLLLLLATTTTTSGVIAAAVQMDTVTVSSTSSSSTADPTPTPTKYAIQCGAGLQSVCESLCVCSTGQCACHSDPTSQCANMCDCVAQY